MDDLPASTTQPPAYDKPTKAMKDSPISASETTEKAEGAGTGEALK